MATNQNQRHACRTIDLKKMFFSLAHSVRLKGKDASWAPIEGGLEYTFRLGDNVCTYSFRKEGTSC